MSALPKNLADGYYHKCHYRTETSSNDIGMAYQNIIGIYYQLKKNTNMTLKLTIFSCIVLKFDQKVLVNENNITTEIILEISKSYYKSLNL